MHRGVEPHVGVAMALQGQLDSGSAGVPGGELFTAGLILQTSLTRNMGSLEALTQPLSSTKAVWGSGDVKLDALLPFSTAASPLDLIKRWLFATSEKLTVFQAAERTGQHLQPG